MNKKNIIEALKQVRKDSKKRNFNQTFDLIINLKDLNFKKPEDQVDLFLQLPHHIGRATKICALVGPELKTDAEAACDFTIGTESFEKYTNKKDVKSLAAKYDFFVAQANIMGQIAKTFGRVLGPRGKMPNPKAGCVVPPKFNLKNLYEKLQNTSRVSAKTAPLIQVSVGKEDMQDEDVAENITTIYNSLIHSLPKEQNNIASILLKTTMGKPVRVSQ